MSSTETSTSSSVVATAENSSSENVPNNTIGSSTSSNTNITTSPSSTPSFSRTDAAKRIRTASQHTMVSPLIKQAMEIIADAVEGEWVTDENVRIVAKTGQLLLGYESEYHELKDRLIKSEKLLAELNTLDDHRATKDYIEATNINKTLLSTTVEQMSQLIEERANHLYDENAELHKRIKGLENTITELRKENMQLKSTVANQTTNSTSSTDNSTNNTTNTANDTNIGSTLAVTGPPDGLVRVKSKK